MKWYSYLIVLVILVVISVYVFKQKESRELGYSETDMYKPNDLIIKQKLDENDFIQLEKKELKTVLTKQNGLWFVQSNTGRLLPCDEKKVSSMLEELEDLKVDMVVSRNPNKFKKFELEDTTAFRVMMKTGNSVKLHFLIGKNNFNFTGSYVRYNDDKMSILTTKRLSSTVVNAKEDFWFDKNIIGEVNQKNVLSINLQYSESENKMRSIERDGDNDTYYVLYNDTKVLAQTNEIQNIIRNLNNLKATDFADTNVKEDVAFAKTSYVCEVKYKDGRRFKFIVGTKSEGAKNYFVKNVDRQYIYMLSENKVKSIFIEDNKLIQQPKKEESKASEEAATPPGSTVPPPPTKEYGPQVMPK